MKAWREIAVPHQDVLEGTFQQSEFAADITAVHTGKASTEYQDAKAFFQRTFITEGMRLLLTQVARRLNGKAGEPVIQLQTAFGGGKTHTMLAVYHLASRKAPLKELAGVPEILDQAKLKDVPKARVAVLDGTDHAPGQPWSHGKHKINTLWGELAWQLGEADAFRLVREADATGTSPGKEQLRQLLEEYAPCVVLVDELVGYIRQFPEGQVLSGGTYDSNLSFVQALTEATKLVPNAILLASLPESEVEAGSSRGVAALRALEKTFGRVQALWKPVATEEAFEIVRMRLFEPIRDTAGRDAVCREFAKTYEAEGSKMPSETHEGRYLDRLKTAYPIHPEIFDRLFEDWTTIDGFQRTRGVLKLMARVVYRLWKDQNQDLLITPGSLPLYDGDSRNELTYYLQPGWDAVLERDIDGPRAETTELDTKETRFGQLAAARRVARTVFLATAPSSAVTTMRTRGIDRARVLLGCLQPGQASATYVDALGRLVDHLHYLNSSGDRTQDTTRFWFDTRATLRREMEDRKGRFDDKSDVRPKAAEVLKKLAGGSSLFDGVHVFTPHSDVPDDGALRLVFLGLDKAHSKQDAGTSADEAKEYLRCNGTKPRYRGNRLLFIAADQGALSRLRDCVRTALAWDSIVDDIDGNRLNVDKLQEKQAKKELETASAVVPKAARECFKWLLCPTMSSPTDREVTVEAFPVNTSGSSFGAELDRACTENELVIGAWSPIHLRSKLKELYWKADRPSVNAMAVWGDMEKYLYLPRLKSRQVFEQALVKGAGGKEFFGTALAEYSGKYEGFKLADSNVQLDDTLLLIEPTAAATYQASVVAAPPVPPPDGKTGEAPAPFGGGPGSAPVPGGTSKPGKTGPNRFFASVEVNPALAKANLVTLAEELIAVLSSDPNSTVSVVVELSADFPRGASANVKRAVTENLANLKMLKFKTNGWE
jgi:hypothetical protein